jgi:hypothetical protein
MQWSASATATTSTALMVGTVTQWRAYQPPHLGMRTQLMSVHSGATVWAVDAIYDTNDRTTISDLRHYAETVQQDDGTCTAGS